MHNQSGYQWGGNVNPSCFVMVNAGTDNSLIQATTGAEVMGISMEATKAAPIAGASGYAGVSGDQAQYYPIGSFALVVVGSGGLTAGADVASDTNGNAVLAATTGTSNIYVAGNAKTSANAGELALIYLNPQCKTPT